MPVDLDQQLADYGAWLEGRCGVVLTPSPPSPAITEPDLVVDAIPVGKHRSPSRRWLLGAAAVLVALCIAGLAALERQPTHRS